MSAGAARRLIVNADDLGYDPAVTRGILRAMREGVVSSATFMVNTPHSVDAAHELRGGAALALGLHLNLARWKPISSAVPAALLVEGDFDEPSAGRLPIESVEAETLAQLDRFEELVGVAATHIDFHKHLHRHPAILRGAARAAATRRLPVRALDAPMRAMLRGRGVATPDHFVGDAGASAHWTLETFERTLAALEPGLTEAMCHPGLTPSHVKSGYGPQREVELATFTSPEARRMLEAAGVELVTFGVLRP